MTDLAGFRGLRSGSLQGFREHSLAPPQSPAALPRSYLSEDKRAIWHSRIEGSGSGTPQAFRANPKLKNPPSASVFRRP